MRYDFEAGALLLIDKPEDWTSFDVVNYIRIQLRRNLGIARIKVGHAGTLDPLATGLLLVCTGKMTRQINHLQDQEKEYTGTIRLGMTTPSYDLETAPDSEKPWQHITEDDIRRLIPDFTGALMQVPPVYSAIKVEGKRAFESARRNRSLALEPRQVFISSFEITGIHLPELHFRVRCSKGTYIRSLAHDFGQALGTGGVLVALRRTAIGQYLVDEAIKPDDFKLMLESATG
ncbi:MAG TPA: tRNA pseudouridine(55) synthase TruB [Bacteroidales bacterium]|nr:tRNA pseudouridine(55) synthase TruB [Bacteroidales bacterium]